MNKYIPSIGQEKRNIRLGVLSFFFCQGLCFSSWASRIPEIKDKIRADDAHWGTILLMIPAGQLIGMSLSGFLVPRLGSKNILQLALFCYAICLLLIGFSASRESLIASLLLFGFFGNFCNICVNTQGVIVEKNIYKKPIMSSFHGGWSLAGFLGALIGLLMENLHISPFLHFIFISILVVISIFINKKFLQPDIQNGETEVDPNESKITTSKKKYRPENFLYLLGIVAFCGMAAEGAMFDWSGIYFKEVVKVPKKMAPLGFTAFMVMMASGRFIADFAIQKWNKKLIIQISGLLIFIGLSLAVLCPNLIVTTLAFMIIGLGTSSIIPTIYSLGGQKSKISTGVALTIISSIGFMGFILGPPIIGYISQIKNLKFSYGLIGLFGICIFLFATYLKVFKEDENKNK